MILMKNKLFELNLITHEIAIKVSPVPALFNYIFRNMHFRSVMSRGETSRPASTDEDSVFWVVSPGYWISIRVSGWERRTEIKL